MSRILTVRKRRDRSRLGLCLTLAVVALLLVGVLPVGAQNGYPIRSDPYINDFAAVISTEDAGNIRQALTDLKSRTDIELVVVTINSISDYSTGDGTLESFATHLFNTWGIGDAQRNDGIMLLVAINDRQLRIELGRGYGGGHSPEMQTIIDNTIVPDFRQSAYSRGIYRGVKAIADQVYGKSASAGSVPVSAPVADSSSRATAVSTNSGLAGPLVLLVGICTAIVAFGLGLNPVQRRLPPKCKSCRIRMVHPAEDSMSAALSPGQLQELAAHSVDHIVWQCPQCGTYQVKSFPRTSPFKHCPQCGFIAITHREVINQKPTTTASGSKTVSDDCAYCHYHFAETIVLPMIMIGSSAGGGDWGGGGDFGGGASDGGGASGSW